MIDLLLEKLLGMVCEVNPLLMQPPFQRSDRQLLLQAWASSKNSSQTCNAYLAEQGLTARGGQNQFYCHLRACAQATESQGERRDQSRLVPEDWQATPTGPQKDLDARWTKKNGVSHYGYKNSISIDAAYGFIRRHVLTPANIHDSQMLPALLDGENADAMVWADSAYQSKLVDSFLKEAGYESRILTRREVATIPWPLLPRKGMGKDPKLVPRWSMSLGKWKW